MPDFVPILVAAVLSLIILILAFGGNLFYIAPAVKAGSRTILLGENFDVSYSLGEENVAKLDGEVSRGLFSGEDKRIEFNADRYSEVSEAIIRLKILDSNYYGNLVIELNGEEIYRGAPFGEKLITVDPKILERGNLLEVKAESSSWRIWAPTVYKFNLNMNVIYEGKRTKTFEFSLSNEEVVNVDYVRLLIYGTRQGVGKLIVNVNDKEVFAGYTTVQASFETDVLKTGVNKVEILTEQNTRYNVSSARVILFF